MRKLLFILAICVPLMAFNQETVKKYQFGIKAAPPPKPGDKPLCHPPETAKAAEIIITTKI